MLQAVYFTDKPVMMGEHPIDRPHAQRNFDLCRAVNLNSLGVVLEEMVKAGLPKDQAACFRAQAEALLQLMRTENNRLRAQALALSGGEDA